MGQLEVVIRELVQCYYRESIKEVTNLFSTFLLVWILKTSDLLLILARLTILAY